MSQVAINASAELLGSLFVEKFFDHMRSRTVMEIETSGNFGPVKHRIMVNSIAVESGHVPPYLWIITGYVEGIGMPIQIYINERAGTGKMSPVA
jgi:hypothetical protein